MFKKENQKISSSREALKLFCLGGSGKGRLTTAKSVQLFSYESEWRNSDKTWALALFFPLYGEINVEMDWSDALVKGNVKLKKISKVKDVKENEMKELINDIFSEASPLLGLYGNAFEKHSYELHCTGREKPK